MAPPEVIVQLGITPSWFESTDPDSNNIGRMGLKPTDHIIMFVEKNDGIKEVFDDFTGMILKAIRCDYVFFVDRLDTYDFFETVGNVLMKGLIYRSDMVTFNKVKYEEGMTINTIEYVKADDMPAL